MGEFLVFILAIMTFYFVGSYLKIKLDSLRQKHNLATPKAKNGLSQNQIDYLMGENEEMKEELRNIKYLLSREPKRERIDFDYEKEQMKLDYDAKGSLSL